MKKTWNRVVALFLALTMVFTMSNVNFDAITANAEGSAIKLGDVHWDSGKETYHFSDATANFGTEGIKIFCVSVDANGSFTFSGLNDLKAASASKFTVTGLDKNNAYLESVAEDAEVTSLTIVGDVDDAKIQTFIRNLTFHRNTTSSVRQKVSVVTSSKELEDDMTALAIDGTLHYYRYVDWADNGKVIYNYNEDNKLSDRTWYNAYKEAKSDTWKYNGMKGYLATVTNDLEQNYIFKNVKFQNAWIGGARTLDSTTTTTAKFDADEITELNPGDKVSDETTALKWRWMCGPEAGEVFTTLKNKDGAGKWGIEVPGNSYAKWDFDTEPNNKTVESALDSNQQEYALQYGFGDQGKWNDWFPSCSAGDPYSTPKTGNMSESFGGVKGFLIEYSPYTQQTPTGPVDIVPENGGSEDSVYVSVDLTVVDAALDKNTVKEGQTISVVTWIGSDSVTPKTATATNASYQWQVKYPDETVANIDGATSPTFTVPDGYAGNVIRCAVTGVDDYTGTVYAGIYTTANGGKDNGILVLKSDVPEPKTITSATLNKTEVKAGESISVATWTGSDSTTPKTATAMNAEYQWQVKDGSTWKDITDATSISFNVPDDYEGKEIRCAVTGKDGYTGTVYVGLTSSKDSSSDNGVPVKPADPVTVALKSAILNTEKPKVGEKVSVTKVTDKNGDDVSLADVTYQWQYKDTDGTWKEIDGATSKDYTVAKDYVGKNLRCDVTPKTGTKYTGEVFAFADADDTTGNISTTPDDPNKGKDNGAGPVDPADKAPVALKTATLNTEEPVVGETVSVIAVTDADGKTVALTDVTYQWQYKDPDGTEWKPIEDATAKTKDLVVPPSMEGKNIRCEITPVDEGEYKGTIYAFADEDDTKGNNKKDSNPTDPTGSNKGEDGEIGPVKPDTTPTPDKKELDTATLDNVSPEVGTPIKVDKITDKNGDEVPGDDVDYKWQKTDKDGNWVNIPDSNKDTYVPTKDDIGSNIRVEITPKDKDKYEDAKIYAYTDKNGKGGATPDKGVGPVKDPNPIVTDKTDGSITIEADPDKEYQIVDKDGNIIVDWTEDGANKDKDGNKTNGKITFDGLDANTTYTVVSRVKGDTNKNNWAQISATTSPKGVVPLKDAGLNTTVPGLGTSVTVATITDKNGKPVVVDSKNATFQWQVSKDGVNWENITGATAASYVMSSKEIGKMIRCAVTGKGDYSGTVYTAATKKVSAEADIPTIVMNKELGYKKKFQIMKLNTKGAIVTYYTANKKYVTVNKKGIITGKKVTKAGKPVKVVFNITKGAHQVQYVTNVRVTKKVKKNYSLVKYKTKYKDPSIALYKLLYVKSKYTIKLKHMNGATATYKSSNEKVATVSKKGVVKGKKKGTADITITVEKNGVTYKYFVKCRVCKRGKVKNDTKYLKVIK